MEQIDARIAVCAKLKTEMAPDTPGHQGLSRYVGDLTRDVDGKLAARTGARSISRTRRERVQVGEGTLIRPVTQLYPLNFYLFHSLFASPAVRRGDT